MKNAGQLLLGFISAIGSTVLVLAAASLALLEGGATAVSVVTVPPTETPVSHTPSPLPILVVTATSAFTPTVTPTEEVYCKETPADWLPYTVQEGDTVTSLVIKSGVTPAEFLKANCFMSESMRLEAGWIVYLPPTAPTATATLTPTPTIELPTLVQCGAPPGWVGYIVQPGDTLFRLSLILGISQYELMQANCLTGTTIYAGQYLYVPFLPPASTWTPVPTETPVDTDTPVPGKATATVTLGTLSFAYDGTPHATTATTVPAGLNVIITYDGATTPPTNAGNYTVVATVNDANYEGSVSGTLVINKATATVTLNIPSPVTYDGSPHGATATTVPDGLAVAITYNGSATAPVDAGSYAVVATVSDANYDGSASGTLVINKAAATVALNIPSPVTYDGGPHGATASTTPAGLAVTITYNGGAAEPVNAGSYSVDATVTDANYEGSASGTLVINQATATVTLTIPSPVTEDGSPHAATASTSPAGLNVIITYNGSTTPPTAAGTYTVIATVEDANYGGSASGTLVINAAVPPP